MNRAPGDIAVVLSVFNGAAFLTQQLDSILAQTFPPAAILIRDDGSSDDSITIINDYATRFPAQIKLLSHPTGNLGARGSYALLLEQALLQSQQAGYAYVALADQDDVWYPDKLAVLRDVLQNLERTDPGAPALVHSDLRVVDETGREVAASLMDFQGLDPGGDTLVAQLLCNTVTGCSALMNTALLQRALPIPEQAMVHDAWLSLVVSKFGRRACVRTPLLDYRQHANNALGAQRRRASGVVGLRQRLSTAGRRKNTEMYQALARQAQAFRERFQTDMTPQELATALQIERLPELGFVRQRWLFRRLKKN